MVAFRHLEGLKWQMMIWWTLQFIKKEKEQKKLAKKETYSSILKFEKIAVPLV